MPNRIIRESVLDSERYLSVSESERLLFLHLCLLADDFGCVNLAPAAIGRRAFSERPTDTRLTKMLASLADVDLLRIYEHEGGRYAFIPKFRQRLQRFSLKNPKPPKSLFQDDQNAVELFSRIRDETIKATVPQQLANRLPTNEVEVEEKRREVEVEENTSKAVDKSTSTPTRNSQRRHADYLYKKPSDL